MIATGIMTLSSTATPCSRPADHGANRCLAGHRAPKRLEPGLQPHERGVIVDRDDGRGDIVGARQDIVAPPEQPPQRAEDPAAWLPENAIRSLSNHLEPLVSLHPAIECCQHPFGLALHDALRADAVRAEELERDARPGDLERLDPRTLFRERLPDVLRAKGRLPWRAPRPAPR